MLLVRAGSFDVLVVFNPPCWPDGHPTTGSLDWATSWRRHTGVPCCCLPSCAREIPMTGCTDCRRPESLSSWWTVFATGRSTMLRCPVSELPHLESKTTRQLVGLHPPISYQNTTKITTIARAASWRTRTTGSCPVRPRRRWRRHPWVVPLSPEAVPRQQQRLHSSATALSTGQTDRWRTSTSRARRFECLERLPRCGAAMLGSRSGWCLWRGSRNCHAAGQFLERSQLFGKGVTRCRKVRRSYRSI